MKKEVDLVPLQILFRRGLRPLRSRSKKSSYNLAKDISSSLTYHPWRLVVVKSRIQLLAQKHTRTNLHFSQKLTLKIYSINRWHIYKYFIYNKDNIFKEPWKKRIILKLGGYTRKNYYKTQFLKGLFLALDIFYEALFLVPVGFGSLSWQAWSINNCEVAHHIRLPISV